jgi:hypothetical protein
MDFSNKLKDSLYWWLGRKRPFIINNDYKLELLFIDKINNSAKIKITNLKNQSEIQLDMQEGEHNVSK